MNEKAIERSAEWYGALIEECNAIVVEKSKIAQQELTEMYLMLGSRILEEAKNAPVTKIVDAVSTDIKIGKANLWYAVAVVRKYGDQVKDLPIEGAMVSWNKTKALVSGTLPAGVDKKQHDFDPYAVARGLWARQTPDNCRVVGEELLRLYRERR